MGAKMAPSFASLYCGRLEKQIILNQLCNPFLPSISNWRRYINYIFSFSPALRLETVP